VDEYVLSSAIPGDEAEALVDIEPFHGALGATVAPTRFAQDSLQEGSGFEPSVSPREGLGFAPTLVIREIVLPGIL
jgi:hypothetical protein